MILYSLEVSERRIFVIEWLFKREE